MSIMFEQRRQQMLDAVPAHQRDSLARRIDRALAEGWRGLGLWIGEEPADESDLVGTPPGGMGVAHYPLILPLPKKE